MEIYKDIPGYEGIYQVSNFGNVRGLDRISANGRKLVGKKLKAGTSGLHVLGFKEKQLILEDMTKSETLCLLTRQD